MVICVRRRRARRQLDTFCCCTASAGGGPDDSARARGNSTHAVLLLVLLEDGDHDLGAAAGKHEQASQLSRSRSSATVGRAGPPQSSGGSSWEGGLSDSLVDREDDVLDASLHEEKRVSFGAGSRARHEGETRLDEVLDEVEDDGLVGERDEGLGVGERQGTETRAETCAHRREGERQPASPRTRDHHSRVDDEARGGTHRLRG